MKTGKKVSITILSVLILALCAVGIIRSTTFPLDPATLPDHICDFYNIGRPQPLSPSIRVYDSVELENTVWYLMEIGEDIDLGYVKLERNILGRYKIVHLGYGGGSFRDGVVRSGEKAYYLFGGRDVTGRIARITMTQNGETCTMENAEERRISCSVQSFLHSSAIMTSTAARCGFTTKTGTTSPRSTI